MQNLGGGAFAGLINNIGSGVMGLRELTQELGKSRLAAAALGAAAFGVGFSVGKGLDDAFFSGRQIRALEGQIKFGEEWSNVLRKISAVSGGAHAQQLALLGSIEDTIAKIQGMQEIPGMFGIKMLGGKEGLSTSEVDALIQKYRQLKDAVSEAQQIANDKAMDQMWTSLNAEQGKLIRGSKFSDDGGQGYELYEPKAGKEFLAIQAQYDAQLDSFRTYTNDKNLISEFSASVEISRAKAVADFQERLDRETAAKKKAVALSFLDSTASILGSAATIAQAFGKKGFVAYKAFATAQALIATYSSATKAYDSMAGIPVVGPALGIAAAAAAIAAGLANVAVINSARPAGVAHGGLENVPREGTYLLSAGERVVQPEQNAMLTRFLNNQDGGGSRQPVHHHLYLEGREIAEFISDASRDGRLIIDARSVVG